MFPKFMPVDLYTGTCIREVGGRRANIRNVNWVSYLGAYIRGGEAAYIRWDVLTGFYLIS